MLAGEGVEVVVTADVAAEVSVGAGEAPGEGTMVRAGLPGAGDVPGGQRPHVAAQ